MHHRTYKPFVAIVDRPPAQGMKPWKLNLGMAILTEDIFQEWIALVKSVLTLELVEETEDRKIEALQIRKKQRKKKRHQERKKTKKKTGKKASKKERKQQRRNRKE